MWWILGAVVLAMGFMVFTGAPYVPSKKRDLEVAFTKLYSLHATDVVVDIGSGDGIVLRMARRHGAGEAVGYEIHPLLVLVSRILSRRDDHVRTYLADYRFAKFPDATTLVYTFGDAHHISRMYLKVQDEATRLGRPLRFVTYAFEIEHIQPNRTVGAHHLYIVKPLRRRRETV